MKGLHRGFAIVFADSYILISLSAIFLAMATQAQAGMPVILRPLHLLLFSGTLAAYNWHRILKNREMGMPGKGSALNLILFLTSLPVLVFTLFLVNRTVLLLLIPAMVVTFLYSLPTRSNLWILPVRKIPFIKIFLVAFAWSYVTVLLPLSGFGSFTDTYSLFPAFSERFILIMAVALPFDIRDAESDRASGIVTLPVAMGEPAARKLAVFLALIFPLTVMMTGLTSAEFPGIGAALFTSAGLLVLLRCNKCRQHPLYYSLFMDGVLLFYGLAVISAVCF